VGQFGLFINGLAKPPGFLQTAVQCTKAKPRQLG
jgi:hypothetical protein